MNNRLGQKLIRCFGVVICVLLICYNSGEQMRFVRDMSGSVSGEELAGINSHMGGPLSLWIEEGEEIYVTGDVAESLQGRQGSVRLLGAIPIKKFSLEERPVIRVMPGGMSIGVSIYADGALVVGLGSVRENEEYCPAAQAGIRAGDVILEANGHAVEDSIHLESICAAGDPVMLTVLRDGRVERYTVQPEYDRQNKVYRVGMWVRDSTSGIGTLSFYNMDTGRYGALGHPITDSDTGEIIGVKEGSIVESSIVGITAGSNGSPGEVIGSFSQASRAVGSIDTNCEFGIYGNAQNIPVNPLYPEGAIIAYPEEVIEGSAHILSAVSGELRAYSCEIIKLYQQDDVRAKGMVIRVTDRDLIELTGGIIQGMSGSPVMQGGKLAGVVTHVFVNDSRCGYCIYAMWMEKVAGTG